MSIKNKILSHSNQFNYYKNEVTRLKKEKELALEESVAQICEAIHQVMEDTPPELIGDISTRGILLTGGGSLIYGLDLLLQRETGIKVEVANDAVSCVAVGTGSALNQIEDLESIYGKKYNSQF